MAFWKKLGKKSKKSTDVDKDVESTKPGQYKLALVGSSEDESEPEKDTKNKVLSSPTTPSILKPNPQKSTISNKSNSSYILKFFSDQKQTETSKKYTTAVRKLSNHNEFEVQKFDHLVQNLESEMEESEVYFLPTIIVEKIGQQEKKNVEILRVFGKVDDVVGRVLSVVGS